MTDRPTLSAAEAARAAGVSAKTISRALKAGRITGAQRLPGGGWAVPVDGLLAAGYTLHRSEPEVMAPQVDSDRVRELEAEVAELRRERDVAVAELRRADDALADVRLALRALAAGDPVNPSSGQGQESAEPSAARGARIPRRWWARGR